MTRLALLLLLLAGCSVQPAGNATPRTAPDLPAQSGAPQSASVVGLPDRGKGTLGDAGNGTSWRQTDNGNAAANPVFDGPMDPPRLRSSWNGQDKAGPSHSGAASGAPPLAAVTYSGRLAWASPSHGPRYLALREPVGTRVEICGPSACLEMTSNDYGPVLSLWKQGRIADVAAAAWERVCGVPLSFGLCPGSVQVLERPRIELPATDLEGGP